MSKSLSDSHPLEMKRWFILLTLLAIAAPAALPLFAGGKYYFSDDGFLHLFRLFSFDRELRRGILYPRWLPEFALGYGLPVLDFYAPLLYYFGETVHWLGLSYTDAIKFSCAFSIVIAALGAYLMGAQFFRATTSPKIGGLLTAVAYIYFPYFILDIYVRGAFAEAMGAAILPWFIWSILRTVTQTTSASVIVTALFFAALMFSHNMVVFFSAPLVGALLLWELRFIPAESRRRALAQVGLAIGLGLALTAIFWLPLLTELQFVLLSHWIQQGTALYEDFFPLQRVIQFSFPFHFTDHPYPLSVLPMALGLICSIAALILYRDQKTRGGLSILGAMVLTESILFADFTTPYWLRVPFVNGIQFPWRLSVFIGLGIALFIGSIGSIILPRLFRTRRTRWLSLGIVILLGGILIWNGVGDLRVGRTYGPRGDPTIGQVARYEINIGRLGFSVQREYLPLTVEMVRERINSPRAEEESPVIALQGFDSSRQVFTITAQNPISVSLRSFYFPGWQGFVDGQRVATYATPPNGLLTMEVPRGTHQIVFAFEDTLPRRIGALISGIGALILLALTLRVIVRRDAGWTRAVSFVGVGTILIAAPSAIALSAPQISWQPARVEVSPQLRVIGWRVENATQDSSGFHVADARDALGLEIVWQVKQPLEDKPFTWRLVDDAGRVRAQREQLARYGSGYAAAWVPNEIVQDAYDLPLEPSMPPGKYQLQVAYANGQPIVVGDVILEHGSAPAEPQPTIAHPSNGQVGGDFRFLGYNSPDTASPGTALTITLFWQAERQVFEDYTVFAQLLDSNGERVAQSDSTPDRINAMSLWQPQTTIVDRRDILIPRQLDPGLYHLIAGMYGTPNNPQRLPVITEAGPSPDDVLQLGAVKIPMNVNAERPQHLENSNLGSTIRFAGDDVTVSADQVELKLYWQAIASPGANYKVFVHLVDETGKIVAQQDRIPDQGRYPTQIWDPGEQVIDAYAFPLKGLNPGRYRVFVGMYLPETGERLVALDANGHEMPDRQIPITSFQVGAR